jgi:hypothetical protein
VIIFENFSFALFTPPLGDFQLCRDEYHKVSGLDNSKQIWDTLKTSHEGNDVTILTKMELVEGELGRFAMIRGEEPTQTYNRLKTLVNK